MDFGLHLHHLGPGLTPAALTALARFGLGLYLLNAFRRRDGLGFRLLLFLAAAAPAGTLLCPAE